MTGDRTDDGATVDAGDWAGPNEGQLHLVVIGDEMVATYPVPARGRFTIGRGENNDVRIEHALISREHAVLHFGATIELEDLGSRNGTKVRGERLAPNSKRTVAPGEMMELGSTMAIIQHSAGALRARRLTTHGYFEARLEEECARQRASGGELAVLRLHAGEDAEPSLVQEVLGEVLRSSDLVASYAPGEYEILLAATNGARAQDVEEKILEALESEGSKIGAALFPRDGRTADALLERACEALPRSGKSGRSERAAGDGEGMVILDGAMRDIYKIGERVAQGSISVLILGETGAGKEVFAEALHKFSPRRDQRFVRINCAALAETLLESELFGHEKGAFTGAVKSKPGLLELAERGTVMLDELGEMPLATQAKLLRVLEQRQVLRVGGLEPRDIDVRFISATNRDLEADVVRGTFRRDLFFRLNGVSLVIPPLRERTAEIEPLAKRFVMRACEELGREDVPAITPRSLSLLLGYAWPGNIRELRNVMERAVLLCAGGEIGPEHLPFEKMTIPWSAPPAQAMGRAPTSPGGEEPDEKRRIMEALEQCGGNQTRAAKVLGIGRRTLTAKLTKYGMPRPKKDAQ